MERRGRGPPWTGSREEALGGGVGPHGEEVQGPLDEGEWGDVGRQLDVEMGREVDGLEGVAGLRSCRKSHQYPCPDKSVRTAVRRTQVAP